MQIVSPFPEAKWVCLEGVSIDQGRSEREPACVYVFLVGTCQLPGMGRGRGSLAGNSEARVPAFFTDAPPRSGGSVYHFF